MAMRVISRPREGDTGLYEDATGVRGKLRKGLPYPLPTITLYITTLVLVFALVDPQGMGFDLFFSLFYFPLFWNLAGPSAIKVFKPKPYLKRMSLYAP